MIETVKKTIRENKCSSDKIVDYIVILSCLDIPYLMFSHKWLSVVMFAIRAILIIVYSTKTMEYLITNKQLRVSKTFIWFNIFLAIMFINTIINSGNWINMLQIMSKPYLIGLYFSYNREIASRYAVFLNRLRMILLACILLDIVSILGFPQGLYATGAYTQNWFLGYKTARMVYLLPYMLLEIKNMIKSPSDVKKAYTCYFGVLLVYSYGAGGTASFLAMCIFTLVSLIIISDKRTSSMQHLVGRVVNIWTIGIVYSLVTIDLVFRSDKSLLLGIVSTVFNKSTTLSHRTVIWGKVIDLYKEKPLMGNGHIDLESYVELIDYSMATSAHNMVLTIMVTTGVIGLLIFTIMYIQSFVGSKNINTKYTTIIMVYITINLIMGITSSAMVFSVFILLPLMLLEGEKNEKKC